jgi:hypothetical protein
MAGQGPGTGERQLGDTIQDLLVAGIRLSTGLTLYGIAQFQKVFDAAAGGQGLPGAAQKLGSTLEVLSNSLESNMDETKREALRSVSRVSAKAIGKVFEALSPEAIIEAGNRLQGRPDGRPDDAPAAAPAGASLAVDVLSRPADI